MGPYGYTFHVIEPEYKDHLSVFKDHILLVPKVVFFFKLHSTCLPCVTGCKEQALAGFTVVAVGFLGFPI